MRDYPRPGGTWICVAGLPCSTFSSLSCHILLLWASQLRHGGLHSLSETGFLTCSNVGPFNTGSPRSDLDLQVGVDVFPVKCGHHHRPTLLGIGRTNAFDCLHTNIKIHEQQKNSKLITINVCCIYLSLFEIFEK